MYKIQDRTRSDGYSSIESEDGYDREDFGWEIEDTSYKRKSFKITKDVINLICKKVTLEQLFKTRYKLSFEEKYSPSGWCFVRQCPFPDHRDSNPSFNYNKEEDRYYCFGCKRGGKSVHFMSQMENISLSEAAERLFEGIGSIEEIYVEAQDKNEDLTDKMLLEFSNVIRAFIEKYKMSKNSLQFAETITWSLDIYLQKHLPRSTISQSNLDERLMFLKNKLNQYVE